MFLLDTNVLSSLRRRSRTETAVRDWAEQAGVEHAFVSVISIWELEQGALSVARRDPPQGTVFREWINGQVLPRYADRLLSVDLPVARVCASLHVPDPMPYRDSLIAATAMVHGLTLVTRNVRDFERTGVSLLNPWDG